MDAKQVFTIPKLEFKRPFVPSVPPSPDFVEGVATRDVHLNDTVWLRIYLPNAKPQKHAAMPVVFYAHGGAYCLGQPDWPPFHAFCHSMAKKSHTVWLSLSYRLAPEHRLPAAYEDGGLALRWLCSQATLQIEGTSDPWLTRDLADFSNCFLAGESAGASIMLKVAMDAVNIDLKPLSIKGLLIIQPAFHTEDKRGHMVDNELNDFQVEVMYDMALPPGETLNYPPINPLHPDAPPLTALAAYPHIFVSTSDKDFRHDMILHFYKVVRGIGKHVQLLVTPGKGHAFHIFEPGSPESDALQRQLVDFIHASCAA